MIPKTIYVFWNSWPLQKGSLLEMCYDSLVACNQDFKIEVIHNGNIAEYMPFVQEAPILQKDNKEFFSYAYLTDVLRFHLLNERGGVWIDFTTMHWNGLTKHWKTLGDVSSFKFVAYHTPSLAASSQYKSIESWFLASAPRHPLVAAVDAQLKTVLTKRDIDLDLQNMRKSTNPTIIWDKGKKYPYHYVYAVMRRVQQTTWKPVEGDHLLVNNVSWIGEGLQPSTKGFLHCCLRIPPPKKIPFIKLTSHDRKVVSVFVENKKVAYPVTAGISTTLVPFAQFLAPIGAYFYQLKTLDAYLASRLTGKTSRRTL